MSLFCGIFFLSFRQLFGDDELRNVQLVKEKLGDDIFGVADCTEGVPIKRKVEFSGFPRQIKK